MRNRLRMALLISGLLIWTVSVMGFAAKPAYAATITVNSTNGTAFGSCNSALCTLPDAITAAASGDTINFSVTGVILLNSSLAPITKNLTIDGGGQIAIDGQTNTGIGSIFIVNTAGITLNLNNLTIQNGSAGSATSHAGGAMYVGAAATINISNCTFTANQALSTGLGGGAIEVLSQSATINISDSSFVSNFASAVSNGQVSGGAIDNEGGATLNIANTFFGSNTVADAPFSGGGAIFTFGSGANAGTVRIANSTFYKNSSGRSAGGAINANPGNRLVHILNSTFLNNVALGNPNNLVNFDGQFILQNSILANGGCYGDFTDLNDLINDATCGTSLGTVSNLDSAPANNGGTTQTIKLLPGSNAIDAVPAGQCVYPSGFPNLAIFNGGAANAINTDQRGVTRAQGPRCDLGAYEVQPGAPASLTVSGFPSPNAAGNVGSVTVTAHDAAGYVAYGYAGTVHFTSSDSGTHTVLPGNYTFQTGDYGSHLFNVTLTQAGTQSITAADAANSLTASQNGISITAANPSQLIFVQQPTGAQANAPITPPITIAEQDTYGNLIASDDSTQISLALASNPGTATITGTTTATLANGVATFGGLSLDKPGSGYKFLAYATAPLTAAISSPFNISALPTSTPTVTPTPPSTATPTATFTPTQPPHGEDTIGIYRSGTFLLRLHNSQGIADLSAAFTAGTKPLPIVGDWTGAGFDSIGVMDQATANFYLRNTISAGTVDESFTFGNPNDTPLSGRWQISATHAGIGVYRPSNGILYMKNTLTSGYSDYSDVLGNPGDIGVAGDWTGKGFDSPGVYRPSGTTFYLSNLVTNGIVYSDISFNYGTSTDLTIAGDWIAQGHDGVGMFRPTTGYVFLKNALTTGSPDNSLIYGQAGDMPIAGHWEPVYPPIPPQPILTRTAIPNRGRGSVPGGNQIGG